MRGGTIATMIITNGVTPVAIPSMTAAINRQLPFTENIQITAAKASDPCAEKLEATGFSTPFGFN